MESIGTDTQHNAIAIASGQAARAGGHSRKKPGLRFRHVSCNVMCQVFTKRYSLACTPVQTEQPATAQIFVAAMPTLVWRRRSESGTGAAGGGNARNTTAAVPDEVVSAAASEVPDAAASAVSILPDPVHVALQPRLASQAPVAVPVLKVQ